MSLLDLPDEIIAKILDLLPTQDFVLGAGLSCRRICHLCDDPLLWRARCISDFKVWSPGHDFKDLLLQPPMGKSWRHLYSLRKNRNQYAEDVLKKMTKSTAIQPLKIDALASLDYDIKEYLVDQCHANVYEGDGLTRQFWATRVLDAMHRRKAISIWAELRESQSNPDTPFAQRRDPGRELERCMAAWDMFTLHGQWGDVDAISELLDEMASSCLRDMNATEASSTREKAVAVNVWLRSSGFRGLRSPSSQYRLLRNCLIGEALHDEDHETIPIVSSVIYCAIAKRIGLDAHCSAIPSNVMVVVYPQPGYTLDGGEADPNMPKDSMYLDPFSRSEEVPKTPLVQWVRTYAAILNPAEVLGPADPVSIVLRTRNNIRLTSDMSDDVPSWETPLGQLRSGESEYNLTCALYGCMWAGLLLDPADETDAGEARRFENFSSWVVEQFPEDAALALSYVKLLLRANPNHSLNEEQVLKKLETARRLSSMGNDGAPTTKSDVGTDEHRFAVGQVFRHRTGRWIGVILRHPTPPKKSYYDVLQSYYDDGYGTISEENVIILNEVDPPPVNLFANAGKYFKRYDIAQCRFIPISTED